MGHFDLALDDLRTYAPDLVVPDGLTTFWRDTLTQARTHDLAATFTAHDAGLSVIDTFDVTFAGFGGAPVRAWLHLPAGATQPLPTVVEYVGYGGGRGLAHERTLYAQAGWAHVVVDTRGQGSGWSVGDTADPDTTGAPRARGVLTDGILDPHTHYYRRVYVDSVRAIEAVREHPLVDDDRVAVTGASQGGGITIAVAALTDGLVGAAPDVPFLSDFPRAATLLNEEPYAEVTVYLATHRAHVEQARRTLAHLDVAILGRCATAPALFPVGLMDVICPPSTVYAATTTTAVRRTSASIPTTTTRAAASFTTW
ncbi:acetylxylan esterase [soil metagenome]